MGSHSKEVTTMCWNVRCDIRCIEYSVFTARRHSLRYSPSSEVPLKSSVTRPIRTRSLQSTSSHLNGSIKHFLNLLKTLPNPDSFRKEKTFDIVFNLKPLNARAWSASIRFLLFEASIRSLLTLELTSRRFWKRTAVTQI